MTGQNKGDLLTKVFA